MGLNFYEGMYWKKIIKATKDTENWWFIEFECGHTAWSKKRKNCRKYPEKIKLCSQCYEEFVLSKKA